MAGDVVWLDVLPSMDKFGGLLGTGAEKASKAAGKSSGAAFGAAFSDAASTSATQAHVAELEKAAARAKKVVADMEQAIAKARASEREASAKALLAEQALADARAKYGDDSAQAAAAELRLEAARERAQSAARKTVQVEEQLRAAHRENREISSQLAQATADLGKEVGQQPGKWDKLTGAMTGAKTEFKGATDNIVALGGALVGTAALAGTFAATWSSSMDLRSGVAKLDAQLYLTQEESARAGRIAGELYADQWGRSASDITGAIGAVISSIQGMREASEADLAAVTKRALAFATAFDVDVAESARNAGILMKNGLARDAVEAFDLMTASLQDVPAALRGEVMDATHEYAQFLAQLGFDGATALGLIVSATENGQYGIDKMGDSLKEFLILATDMSAKTTGAFETIGLDAGEMANALLAGGDVAQDAFQKIIDGLQGIEDPATQANTAIALFGTPLEDLGVGKIPQFLASLDPMATRLSEVAGASDGVVSSLEAGKDPIEGLTRQFGSLLRDGLDPLVGPITSFTEWARETPGALEAIGIVLGTVTAAVVALTVAQWAYNVAQYANPTVWIIAAVVAAIGLLVAAVVLIVKNWEPISNWFIGVWEAISGAVSAAWDWIVDKATAAWNWLYENVFAPIGAVVGAVVSWFTDTLAPALATVWDGIVMGAQFAWTVLQVIFVTIATAFTLLFEVFLWVWDHTGRPVVDAIGAAFVWVWEHVIQPAWEALKLYFELVWAVIRDYVFTPLSVAWQAVGDGFQWVWEHVIKVAWEALKLYFQTVWDFVREKVFDPLKTAWEAVGDGFQWVWEHVIKAAWDGIRSGAEAAWDFLREKVFDPLKTAADTMGEAFGRAKDTIGAAWDQVKGAAAKPVNFVIETVYMQGIKATWDRIAGSIGLDLRLPTVSPVKWASGGVLPGWTPGVDIHHFVSPTAGELWLSGGEAIMVPEWTRAVGGPAAVAAMNQAARENRFDDGGVLGFLSNVVGGLADAVTDPVGMVRRLIEGPVRGMLSRVGGGMGGKVAAALPLRAVDGLISFVRSAMSGAGGASGGVLALAGGPLLMDSGGWLPPGPSIVVNGTGAPELLARVDTRGPGPGGGATAMRMPRELVVVDADRQLIGRMRVEAGRVATGRVKPADEGRSRW